MQPKFGSLISCVLLVLMAPVHSISADEAAQQEETLKLQDSESSRYTGLTVFEGDGNYSWDLALSGDRSFDVVYTEGRAGAVSVVRSDRISTGALGSRAADFNNDGHIDLLTWGRHGLDLYSGSADGTFARMPDTLRHQSRVQLCRVADMNGDGDLDIIVLSDGKVVVLDNRSGNSQRWIRVIIRGDEGAMRGIVNHYAIGTVVEVKAGARYQSRIVTGTGPLHFGLGEAADLDVVHVDFPGIGAQVAIRPRANINLLIGKRIRGPK